MQTREPSSQKRMRNYCYWHKKNASRTHKKTCKSIRAELTKESQRRASRAHNKMQLRATTATNTTATATTTATTSTAAASTPAATTDITISRVMQQRANTRAELTETNAKLLLLLSLLPLLLLCECYHYRH